MIGQYEWNTLADWTRTYFWDALRVSRKIEECSSPVMRFHTTEIVLTIKSFIWNLYARWMKWYHPTLQMSMVFHRRLWIMLDTPPNCTICVLGWVVWCESGFSWKCSESFKKLRGLHPDESFRVTLKGPKPMPYQFGVTYVHGFLYCAGLHAEFGVIGPLSPHWMNS